MLRLFDNQLSVFDLVRLNYVAGAVYAEAAQALLDQTGVDPAAVTCIGVDGQTILSGADRSPRDPGASARIWDGGEVAGWTLRVRPAEIGEFAIIAAHTGIPVVNHFRPADDALGGTGAPLMQYLDWVAFPGTTPRS